MQEIKPLPRYLPAAAPPGERVAYIQSDRGCLAVLQVGDLRRMQDENYKLKAERTGWICLAICGCIVGMIGGIFAWGLHDQYSGMLPQPPVIVEKPIVVDRNCIAWCR